MNSFQNLKAFYYLKYDTVSTRAFKCPFAIWEGLIMSREIDWFESVSAWFEMEFAILFASFECRFSDWSTKFIRTISTVIFSITNEITIDTFAVWTMECVLRTSTDSAHKWHQCVACKKFPFLTDIFLKCSLKWYKWALRKLSFVFLLFFVSRHLF